MAWTPEERVRAAIALERPDRVPVVPCLLPEPAATLAGYSQAEVAGDVGTAVQAIFEVFDAFGGWDAIYPGAYTPLQLQADGTFPLRMKIPGIDLPADVPYQLEESEILQPHDYETIAEIGFESFYFEEFLWRLGNIEPKDLPHLQEERVRGGMLLIEGCTKRGVEPLFLASSLHPFFALSLMRSLTRFIEDVYYAPELVERALERMTNDLIETRLESAKQLGRSLWLLTEERASTAIFPPAVFERLWWPYTRRIVDAFFSAGIVTLFHLDTCWDGNLAYFKQLPQGSAVLEFDGSTNLVAAARQLGIFANHHQAQRMKGADTQSVGPLAQTLLQPL
ncbi:MAG: hypothetical protein D6815_12765, partial [Candidatus Dadabacteria bacterium]